MPRALFYALMSYSLLNEVDGQARTKGVDSFGLGSGVLALAVMIFVVLANLPDPWSLLLFLGFLPLLPVRSTIERINLQAAPDADLNTRIKGWNNLAVVLGGLLVILVVVGTFMPDL